MRRILVGALVLAVAFSGCAENGASYELRGTFTEEASEGDMDDLQSEVEERGGQMARLESFPVQFHATGLGPTDCEEVLSFAQAADYVQEVGPCQLDEDDTGGDEPPGNS